MEIDEIKGILKGSGKKHIIIGAFILAFGLFFIIAAPLGLDVSATQRIIIATIVMGALIGFVGLIMIISSIKIRLSVNNETHPLIKAIRENDKEALVWAHALVFKVKGDLSNMKNWNMIFYFKNGKRAHAEIKNEEVYKQLRKYLKQQFPDAELNYDDQIKGQMKEKYGIK